MVVRLDQIVSNFNKQANRSQDVSYITIENIPALKLEELVKKMHNNHSRDKDNTCDKYRVRSTND